MTREPLPFGWSTPAGNVFYGAPIGNGGHHRSGEGHTADGIRVRGRPLRNHGS